MPIARSGDMALIPPPSIGLTTSGNAGRYELHGITVLQGRTVALLTPHNGSPTPFAQGATIIPGLTVAEIGAGHVLLAESGQLHRIDLPPRLGGSGETVAPQDRGLRAERQSASGERSGVEVAAQVARASGGVPAAMTPEEQEAARAGELPTTRW
ncbi:hypothetical protein HL653_21475 [Sphingomonas sp. AP4-R1]|uniref:hypothetical protein n=1 Tax=Sphingomonas sp. AP4-R1 TaxID=2735134 RepID=UPI0014933223|nr:hypothetical protein [Sphingomonas sp. AP4-R1]QJU59974.1 hypothetical protein HL653_21475 [Sphingomonas sp. AP4-R1]